MQIGSLEVKIGIKGGKESIATMNQLKTTTLAAKAAIVAAVVGFAKMSQEARKLAMNLDVFEKTTGKSGVALQKMSFQAAAAGVNLSNLDSTLQSIQQSIIDISLGEGNIKPFQRWGIGLNKDPEKVLDQIGKKLRELEKTSPALASKMARDFGLSNQMMYFLLEEQSKERNHQFLLNKKDKEALVQLNKEWYKLLWYVKAIAIRSQGFLAHVAIPVVKMMKSLVKTFGEIAIWWGQFLESSKNAQKVLFVIGLLVAAVAAYFFPITASLILIVAAVEDIYGFLTGKDSITGRMIEWVKSGEILKAIFLTIAEIIRNISNMIFGRKFTRKITDILQNKDENGTPHPLGEEVAKKMTTGGVSKLLSPSSIVNDMATGKASLLRPNIPGVGKTFNIVQHNQAVFEDKGNNLDNAETAGEYNKSSLVSDTEMQQYELANAQ